MEADEDRQPVERIPTSVPGVDTIVQGGLLRGGVYIVQGRPGAGKTVFANQVAYGLAAMGRRAVYVTLLAEAHARMLLHLRSMSFFDPSVLPERVTYVSAFKTLVEHGLDGLLELLRGEMRAHGATLLVVDGLVAAEESTTASVQYKQFLHALQVRASLVGCTVLLLTSGAQTDVHPEYTMVDGIFELDVAVVERRAVRRLTVVKFRGSGILEGEHSVQITDAGVAVFPRLEALLGTPSPAIHGSNARLETGIAGLDAMLGGGLPAGSSTLVLGATGTGKTITAMHFLSGASAAEPGLYFGMYESPPMLLRQADSLGLGLSAAVARGDVELLWQPSGERSLDALGNQLLDAVDRRGVRRLVLDGLGGLRKATIDRPRVDKALAMLGHALRARGVTVVYVAEARRVFGSTLDAPFVDDSSLVENLVLLRYDPRDGLLRRRLSIIKLRDGAFDPRAREFEITARGVVVPSSVAGGPPRRASTAKPRKGGRTRTP